MLGRAVVLIWLWVNGVVWVKITGLGCLEYTENGVERSSPRFSLMIKAALKANHLHQNTRGGYWARGCATTAPFMIGGGNVANRRKRPVWKAVRVVTLSSSRDRHVFSIDRYIICLAI